MPCVGDLTSDHSTHGATRLLWCCAVRFSAHFASRACLPTEVGPAGRPLRKSARIQAIVRGRVERVRSFCSIERQHHHTGAQRVRGKLLLWLVLLQRFPVCWAGNHHPRTGSPKTCHRSGSAGEHRRSTLVPGCTLVWCPGRNLLAPAVLGTATGRA